jgi:protein TonB
MQRDLLKRHLVAALSTALGGSLVLGTVWAMNNYSTPPPKTEREATAQFHVETPPKKKEDRAQRSKPKPRSPERRVQTHAPAPNLGTALTGLSFDLPAFDMGDLADSTRSLLGEASENQVMTADSVDEKPQPRRQVPPAFPDQARKRGVQGFVKVSILIDNMGSVSKAKVLEAEPVGVFEEPALAAVRQWEFDPPRYNGKPVSMWAEQILRFRLN